MCRTLVQVTVAVFYCLLSAGVVFRYAAIKPVLVRQGVYNEYCPVEAMNSKYTTCYEQELR